MKKVKYNGDVEVIMPTHHKTVKKGDVIEVEDNFNNANFEDYIEENKKNKGDK